MSETDSIPTMTIRPRPKQEGDGGTSPTGKLSYGNMVQKWKALGYSDGGARGIADNMTRESGGDPTAIGPGGAAIGLFQHEGPRREALEKFAKDRGTKPTDPDTQIAFADNELKTDYPTLREQLQKSTDRAASENSFKRVFERPKSVLWGERPKTETPDFRFSPYAMAEHAKRPNTDVVLMAPDDYLDLAPALGGRPFANPAGRSLLASVDKGEPIEAIPTLDVDVKGNTGTVTDQDGRHRALLAKHAGVDAIPVAIQKNGEGEPTELAGMSGKVLPNRFPKVQQQKPQQRSLLQRAGDAIIPRAEAAEPSAGATGPAAEAWPDDPIVEGGPQQGAAPHAPAPDSNEQWPDDPIVEGGDSAAAAKPDGMALSALKGAGYGVGKTALAGQELLGEGLRAVGVSSVGGWLVDDARKGMKQLDQDIAPDQAAHPYATGAGEFAGGMAVPMGAVGLGGKLLGRYAPAIARAGGNALKGAAAGGVVGALQPGDPEHYWADKAGETALGAGLGAAGNALAAQASRLIAPRMRPIYEFVERVTGKPASKSPGAMSVIKRMESDQRAGGSTAQDMLDLANQTPDKPLTLADLGGPEVRALAGRVARGPGDGRAVMTNFLNERDRGAGARLAGDVDREIQRKSAYEQGKALDRSRKIAAQPLYDGAYAHPPINPDEMQGNGRIGRLMNRPSFRAGMQNAIKISAEEGVPLKTLGIDLDAQGVPFFTEVPTWRTLDYVKRGMDDVIEEFRSDVTGRLKLDTYGRAANNTRTDFRDTLRDLNGPYAAALDAYSGPSTSLDALHAGQDFLLRSPEEIADRIGRFGAGDREFFKIGAADTLRTRMEKKGVTADEAKAIVNSPYMARQLRPLFESDAAFKRFTNAVQAEAKMYATRFDVLGGSQTAARRGEDTSPDLEALVQIGRGALHAKTGNLPAAMQSLWRGAKAWKSGRDPAVNAGIADILTHPIASGTTGQRMNDFKTFMAALPTTRAHMTRNALADMTRAAGPAAGVGLAQIPSMTVRPGDQQNGQGQ
jgi:hypothetical protein